MGSEGRGTTASGVRGSEAGAGTPAVQSLSRKGGLMNKQQSGAPSPLASQTEERAATAAGAAAGMPSAGAAALRALLG